MDSPNRSCRKTRDPKHESSPTAEIGVAQWKAGSVAWGTERLPQMGARRQGTSGVHRYVPAQSDPAQDLGGACPTGPQGCPGGWWGRTAPAR